MNTTFSLPVQDQKLVRTSEVSDLPSGEDRAAGHLLPHHHGMLRGAAISDAVIEARGYWTASRPTPGDERPRRKLNQLGIPRSVTKIDTAFPGIGIPQYRPTGEPSSTYYRPDKPPKDPKTGKVRKYIMPARRPPVVDVHPFNRDKILDPTIPLWITEGNKKGDALTSAGACVVTLAGVFNWRSRLGTLGDWEDILLRGRSRIYICYDADAAVNPNVANAMRRLGSWLRNGGQRGHRGGRRGQGHVEQDPLAALPVHLDAAGDALLALGPEPGQALQPARLDRRRQLVDRGYAQVMVELQGALGPEARHPGQLEDAGRDLGAQLVEGLDAAGVAVFGDLGRDRGADRGNGTQGLDVERADVLAPAADRARRLLVVPGPEHVAAGDLDQLGVLGQQPRDYLIQPGHTEYFRGVPGGRLSQGGSGGMGPPRERSQQSLSMAGEGTAAVVRHHVAQGVDEIGVVEVPASVRLQVGVDVLADLADFAQAHRRAPWSAPAAAAISRAAPRT